MPVNSVRKNITFYSPYERARYKTAVKACAMEPDLEVLPAGDLTAIGDRGINLSGTGEQGTVDSALDSSVEHVVAAVLLRNNCRRPEAAAGSVSSCLQPSRRVAVR